MWLTRLRYKIRLYLFLRHDVGSLLSNNVLSTVPLWNRKPAVSCIGDIYQLILLQPNTLVSSHSCTHTDAHAAT